MRKFKERAGIGKNPIIVMFVITVAMFTFLLIYPLGCAHFITTMLFPLWWLVITIRYKSWYRISTWIWACITLLLLLLVPLLFMILDAFYPFNAVISIFFAALFAYSASYYLIIKRRA
jgi:hypothetical protein